MKTFTVSGRVRIARNITTASANVKAWRLRTIKDRQLQQIAKEITLKRGYLTATCAEIEKRFPTLWKSHSQEERASEKLRIFGIHCSIDVKGYAHLSFCTI